MQCLSRETIKLSNYDKGIKIYFKFKFNVFTHVVATYIFLNKFFQKYIYYLCIPLLIYSLGLKVAYITHEHVYYHPSSPLPITKKIMVCII